MIGLSVLLAVFVYFWLARFVVRRVGNRAAKYAVIVVFILIPTWDIILGKLYLSHLCSTEAGAKVYRTVELPAEYWDEKGRPKFYVNQYEHNKLRYIFQNKKMVDAPEFQYTWVTKPYSEFFHIEKDVLQIVDREKRIVIGEYFLFRYWGGWIARNFSPHNSAISCEAKDLDSWPLNIFKPTTSIL